MTDRVSTEGRRDQSDAALRLVVGEDDVLFREGVVRLLLEAGFDVVAQALEAFEHAGFGGLVLFLERLGGKFLTGIDGVREIEEGEDLHARRTS